MCLQGADALFRLFSVAVIAMVGWLVGWLMESLYSYAGGDFLHYSPDLDWNRAQKVK
jgi:hypothetical protein